MAVFWLAAMVKISDDTAGFSAITACRYSGILALCHRQHCLCYNGLLLRVLSLLNSKLKQTHI